MEQGPRQPHDGPIFVEILEEDILRINIKHNGQEQRMLVGKYNAFRLFGVLAVMLGVKISKNVLSAIKLGGSIEVSDGSGVPRE